MKYTLLLLFLLGYTGAHAQDNVESAELLTHRYSYFVDHGRAMEKWSAKEVTPCHKSATLAALYHQAMITTKGLPEEQEFSRLYAFEIHNTSFCMQGISPDSYEAQYRKRIAEGKVVRIKPETDIHNTNPQPGLNA